MFHIIFQVEEATNKLSFIELKAQNLPRTVRLAWVDESSNPRHNSRTIQTGRIRPNSEQIEFNSSKEQATRIARYICVFGISPGVKWLPIFFDGYCFKKLECFENSFNQKLNYNCKFVDMKYMKV